MIYLSLVLLIIGFKSNPSATLAEEGDLESVNCDSPPSSPNKNAAFSRLAPEIGFLLDGVANEDGDLGNGSLLPRPDVEESSESSIHEKEELAIVERVGTGTAGRFRWPCEVIESFGSGLVLIVAPRSGVVSSNFVFSGATIEGVEIGVTSAPVDFGTGSGIDGVMVIGVGDSGLFCGVGIGLDAESDDVGIAEEDISSSAGSGIVESSR